jgi:acyl-homoserine lactone acylase PvdQ
VRHLTFPHSFAKVPLLGSLFSVGPIPMAGDGSTINVAKVDPGRPGEVLFAPSCRVVFTPGDWSRSRLTLPLGQSGHRLSPYRDDQLADWLRGDTHPMPWGGPAAGTEIGVLTLTP